MTDETCGNCAYLLDLNVGHGVCRRYPPQGENGSPIMKKEDWCGEHLPSNSFLDQQHRQGIKDSYKALDWLEKEKP